MTQEYICPPRGWGLENRQLPVGGPSPREHTQAVRDTISEALPSIIEATLGQWLSKFEEKQRAWFQEMLREQQAASQAAQSAAVAQLWEAKVDELVEAIERHHHAIDGIVVQTKAVVRETTRDATVDAVKEAMAQLPRDVSTCSDVAAPGPPSPAVLKEQGGTPQRDPQHPGASPSIGFFRAATTLSDRSDGEAASRGIDGDGGPADVRTSTREPTRESTRIVALEEPPKENFLRMCLARASSLRKARQSFFQQRRDDYLRDRANARDKSTLEYIVLSGNFDIAVTVVILLHVAYMIYETDRSFTRGAASAGVGHIIIESAFWLVYAVELVVKIVVEREEFCAGRNRLLYLLDAFLVVTGFIDIVALMLAQHTVVGTMGLKVLRVVRLNKLARTHRLFLFSEDTQLLMRSLGACAISLAGPFCLLLGYFLVMSLWIVPSVTSHLGESSGALSQDEVRFLTDNFGSVSKSMFALYQSLSGGLNWMPFYGSLSAIDDLFVGAPFVVFHSVYTFMMVHVVLCMFLGKFVLFSLSQSQGLRYDQRRQDHRDLKWILEWCEVEYCRGSTINYKDFLNLMRKAELRSLFSSRGVTIDDTRTIFKALAPEATQEGTFREWEFNVDRKQFFEASMRLKREVTTTDILVANALLERSVRRQEALSEEAALKVESLEAKVTAAMRRVSLESGSPRAPEAPR